MRRTLMILIVAFLLTACAFAGKKRDQNTTDWLNTPMPDGSPTLKETSDWLNKVLLEYHAGNSAVDENTLTVSIDNGCMQ